MTTYTLLIVGARYRPPAAGLLAVLPAGAPLVLRREPSNAYDSNAIQVFVETSTLEQLDETRLADAISGFGFTLADIVAETEWHLGYVPKADAQGLAPAMDQFVGVDDKGPTACCELRGELTFTASGVPSVRADFPQQ